MNRRLRARLIGAASALLLAAVAHAQDNSDWREAAGWHEQARSANAELLAPRAFQRATRSLQSAQDLAAQDAGTERVARANAEALVDARAAFRLTEAAGKTLAATLAARTAASAADARLYSEAEWRAGEKRLADAVAALEREDASRASERSAEALAHYRLAELNAIKTTWLGDTRALIAQAEDQKAERYAPATLANARALLTRAAQALESDRYDLEQPVELARAARREASHALFLSAQIRTAIEQQRTVEDVILEWEAAVAAIAEAAGVVVSFEAGHTAATTALRDYILAMQAAAMTRESELADRNRAIRALQQELAAVEEQFSGLNQERLIIAEELEAQERFRRRLQAIEQLFTADEAEVLRERGEVLIRLTGISFATGQASLGTDQGPLLDKLAQALSLFPGRPVSIEGHTDSEGRDEANLTLSRERAAAVRQYLLARTATAQSLMSATGYGEERPVANNETREGRARNRRIDVRIQVDTTPSN